MNIVKGKLVDSLFTRTPDPGDFQFYKESATSDAIGGMMFSCPCGCGAVIGVNLSPNTGNGPPWNWDGNKEAPTITPSVRHLDGCKWQGWIKNGEFHTC